VGPEGRQAEGEALFVGTTSRPFPTGKTGRWRFSVAFNRLISLVHLERYDRAFASYVRGREMIIDEIIFLRIRTWIFHRES